MIDLSLVLIILALGMFGQLFLDFCLVFMKGDLIFDKQHIIKTSVSAPCRDMYEFTENHWILRFLKIVFRDNNRAQVNTSLQPFVKLRS